MKIPIPDSPPEWCIVIGAWGDVMAGLGNVKAILRETGGEQCGILHYGYDPSIVRFIEQQPFCSKAVHIQAHWPPEFEGIIQRASRQYQCPPEDREWIRHALNGIDIDPLSVWPAHVETRSGIDWEPEYWHDPVLPHKSDMAFGMCYERPYLLFHPYSYQSTRSYNHWPHWVKAIRLAAETGGAAILTGQIDQIHGDWLPDDLRLSGNVCDGRGKESYEWALDMARCADLIVTTSNSLAIWSVIADRPAIVCCNRMMSEKRGYFRRWTEAGKNRIVEFNDTFSAFEKAFQEAGP